MRTIDEVGPEAREVLEQILRRHEEDDDELIEVVLAHGSDTSLPHQLRYFLYGEAEQLAVVRRFVEAEGWTVVESDPSADVSIVPEAGNSLTVATGWMPLTPAHVKATTAKLATAASLNGVMLDGWETAIRAKGDGMPEMMPA